MGILCRVRRIEGRIGETTGSEPVHREKTRGNFRTDTGMATQCNYKVPIYRRNDTWGKGRDKDLVQTKYIHELFTIVII